MDNNTYYCLDGSEHDVATRFYDSGFAFNECKVCGKRSFQRVSKTPVLPRINIMNEWLAGNPIESIKRSV